MTAPDVTAAANAVRAAIAPRAPTVAIVLGIVAVAFLGTSLIGWCPTYVLFGISTSKGK